MLYTHQLNVGDWPSAEEINSACIECPIASICLRKKEILVVAADAERNDLLGRIPRCNKRCDNRLVTAGISHSHCFCFSVWNFLKRKARKVCFHYGLFVVCGFQIPNFTLESYEPLVHDGSSYVRLSEKSEEQVTLNVRSKLI